MVLDTNTQTKPLDVKVTVNPVAEIIGNIPGSGDSDNDGTADLDHDRWSLTRQQVQKTHGIHWVLRVDLILANGWTNRRHLTDLCTFNS